jgi:hypothetical protein
MQATLHLPYTTPRSLTVAELAVLRPQMVSGHLTLDFKAVVPALRELLGTAVPGEVLASGPNYLVIGAENAADYDFAATPSATTDFARLTGLEPDEDEPLVGPVLIIES